MGHALNLIFAISFGTSALGISACSGSADPGKGEDNNTPPPSGQGGGDDAGSTANDDAGPTGDAAPGADASAYPAFKPDIGQLVNVGGAIVAAPKIVSVVWTADPNYKALEQLSDRIGASAFWKTALTEYGVGAATAGTHVEITTAPPASFNDSTANDEIDAFVRDGVGGAPDNGWPLPDDQTIYMIYIPESVAILNGTTDDCANNAGYHTETTVGSYQHVAYGVVLEKCHYQTPVLDNATETAAHEIAEAATDPHTNTDLAWTGFDKDHYAWELWQQRQDENGDACEFYEDSYYKDDELGAYMQRLWSNAAAAAGKNPCVPAPDEAYFNATPLAQETISPTGTTGKTRTMKGYHAPVGSTKTFDVGLYSDRATDDWSVDAVEGDGSATPATKHLELSIDHGTGNNGSTAKVTVKVLKLPSKGNQILMTLVSSRKDGATRYFPVIIGAY